MDAIFSPADIASPSRLLLPETVYGVDDRRMLKQEESVEHATPAAPAAAKSKEKRPSAPHPARPLARRKMRRPRQEYRKKMSPELHEMLAVLVRDHRYLYDSEEPDFRNLVVREAAWRTIQTAIIEHPTGDEFPLDQLRKTWRNMYDYFRSKRLRGDTTLEKWRYFGVTRFLLDVHMEANEATRERRMALRLQADESMTEVIYVDDEEDEEDSNEGTAEASPSHAGMNDRPLFYTSSSLAAAADSSHKPPSLALPASPTPPNQKSSHRRSHHSQEPRKAHPSSSPLAKVPALLPLVKSAPEQPESSNSSKEEDPIDSWFASIVADIRRVRAANSREFLQLRRKIQNAVFDSLDVVHEEETERNGTTR